MLMVLEKHLVDEMGRIGEERRPTEACGLLLPFPWREQQIFEMPNRSKTPHDSFVMKGSDIELVLAEFFEENEDKSMWPQITAWHTHPGGNVGPSVEDLRNKPKLIRSLVVSLHEDGPKATWF